MANVQDISTQDVETFYLLDFASPQGFAVEGAKKAKQYWRWSLDPEILIKKGKVSLEENETLIDQALGRCFAVSLGQGKFGQCVAVRGDAVANLRSELGNQLAAKSWDQGLR